MTTKYFEEDPMIKIFKSRYLSTSLHGHGSTPLLDLPKA